MSGQSCTHPLLQVAGFCELFQRLREHDPATFVHCQSVASLAARFARALRLPNPGDYYLAGLAHDIGKLGVSGAVLNKPGKLDDKERQIIEQHPVVGEQLLTGLGLPSSTMSAVRQHHERWDGEGYPDGLAGREIPFSARLVALADVYTAMTEDRPYRPRGSIRHEDVIGHIRSQSGRQFDPVLCMAFVATMTDSLSDIPIVINANHNP